MGFEDKFLSGIDRNLNQRKKTAGTERMSNIKSSVEQLIPLELADARSYLESQAIDIAGFSDLYGEQVIKNDQETVAKIKGSFAKNGWEASSQSGGVSSEQMKQLSEITESYLLRGLNESGWIPHCKGIKTAEYDDYMNGVDLVLEYARPNSPDPARHIGLGVDVTFSADIERKITKIKEEIDYGTLPNIKYFDSPNSQMRGQLKQVPRAIVGFDTDSIKRLAKFRHMNSELPANDPLRFVTLHQLNLQMRAFSEYASKTGSRSKDVLAKTSGFVKLLTDYVKQNNRYNPELIENNEQVKRFMQALQMFE